PASAPPCAGAAPPENDVPTNSTSVSRPDPSNCSTPTRESASGLESHPSIAIANWPLRVEFAKFDVVCRSAVPSSDALELAFTKNAREGLTIQTACVRVLVQVFPLTLLTATLPFAAAVKQDEKLMFEETVPSWLMSSVPLMEPEFAVNCPTVWMPLKKLLS